MRWRGTRPRGRISSSICSGGGSAPLRPGRAGDRLVHQGSAQVVDARGERLADAVRPELHPARLNVRDPEDGVRAARRRARAAPRQGRPAPRRPQVDRRLHRHERQRHELGEPAGALLLLARPEQVPGPVHRPLDVAEHERHVRAKPDAVRSPVHLEPLGGRDLVRADDGAHLVVRISAAVPGSDPSPRSRSLTKWVSRSRPSVAAPCHTRARRRRGRESAARPPGSPTRHRSHP